MTFINVTDTNLPIIKGYIKRLKQDKVRFYHATRNYREEAEQALENQKGGFVDEFGRVVALDEKEFFEFWIRKYMTRPARDRMHSAIRTKLSYLRKSKKTIKVTPEVHEKLTDMTVLYDCTMDKAIRILLKEHKQ